MTAPIGGLTSSATTYMHVRQWFGYTVTWITKTAIIPLYEFNRSMLSMCYRLFYHAIRNAKQFFFVDNSQRTVDFLVGAGIGAGIYSVCLFLYEEHFKDIHYSRGINRIPVVAPTSQAPNIPPSPATPSTSGSKISISIPDRSVLQSDTNNNSIPGRPLPPPIEVVGSASDSASSSGSSSSSLPPTTT